MKKSLYIIISMFLFLQFTSLNGQNLKQAKKNAQQKNFINQVFEKLKEYNTLNFHEKIYLHFDKPFYVQGEDIWFSIYLVNAQDHSTIVPSNIVYVELIDPNNEIVVTKTIKVSGGKAAGDFEIKKSRIPGIYTVRAYTNYMRNYDQDFFFKKIIRIKGLNNDMMTLNDKEKSIKTKNGNGGEKEKFGFDFQVFPEGGDLIEGLPSVVGFKAINNLGKGFEIEGGLFDQNGGLLTYFKSNKFGIGTFNVTPENGKSYFVKLKVAEQDYKYQLPQAKTEGFVMRVDNFDENQINIFFKSNINQGIKNATLIGHIRGKIVFAQDQFPDKKAIQVKVSKSKLKDGILHLTLFDENGFPRCERLVFILNNENQINTIVSSDKKSYPDRSKVKLAVNLKDFNRNVVKGNLSVAITKENLVSHDEDEDNIFSYLLISSDLKGNIERPNYYFNNINKQKIQDLDQLMLTHGWRRFNWNEVINEEDNEIKFYPEKGENISGQVIDFYNDKKTLKSKVSLIAMNELVELKEVLTSEDGRFLFMGYDLPSSTDIILKATGYKKKKKKRVETKSVKIILDQFTPPQLSKELTEPLESNYFTPKEEVLDENYLIQLEKINTNNQLYKFDKDALILKELTIKSTSQKKKDPYYFEGRLYTTPTHRFDFTKYPTAATATNGLEALINASIPGVRVSGAFPDYCVKLRESSSIDGNNCISAFLLDNVLVDALVIASLSPSTLQYVDIVYNSPIYGQRGANGIIAFYTKLGIRKGIVPDAKGVVSFKSKTYNIGREFYSPKYDVIKQEHSKPDNRITLYWNPIVKTNDEGETLLEFYTADDKAKYRIDIQGISEKGQPFLTTKTFSVGKRK